MACEPEAWQSLRVLLSRRQGGEARARKFLTDRPLAQLARLNAHEWIEHLYVSPLEAQRLVGAFRLGRAVECESLPDRPVLRRAKDVHAFMAPRLRGLHQERFVVLHLNAQNRLQEISEVSVGTLTSSLVHPREVFAPALAVRAAAVIVAHNHPSGDPEPSQADRDVTRRLIRAGLLLGIPVLDHVICGHNAWRSMREAMDFEGAAQRVADTTMTR